MNQIDNIEDKIKDIILSNENDAGDKSGLIAKLCQMFPTLSQVANNINLTNIQNKKAIDVTNNEIILEEVYSQNGIILYKDKNRNVWNEQAEMVGIFDSNSVKHFNDPDRKFELNNDITKYL